MSGSIPPVNNPLPRPAPPQTQVVELKSLPQALQDVSRPTRVQGEVIRENDDGTTRVRTPQGDIDIGVKGRQPQEGERINIDIPPGDPPRTATIRPAPPQTPAPPAPPETGEHTPPVQTIPLPQTPVTKPSPQIPAQGQQPPTSTGGQGQVIQQPPQPPVQPSTGVPQAPVTQPAQPPAGTAAPAQSPIDGTNQPLPSLPTAEPPPTSLPLTAGQIIRLVPAPITETIAPQKTAQTGSFATFAAQKSQGNLVSSLLQAVKAVIVPSNTSTSPAVQPSNPGLPKIALPAQPAPQAGITIPIPEDTQVPQPLQLLQMDAKILTVKSPIGQIITTVPDETGAIIKIAPPLTMAHASPLPDQPEVPMPQSLPPSGTVPSKPFPLAATITSFTPQNIPVATIPLQAGAPPQNFLLPFSVSNLQEGSQLIVIPQSAVPAFGSTLPTGVKPLLPLLQPSLLWPAADDIYQTFFQTTPQAGQIMARILPTPSNPASIAPTAFLFAAAVGAGDLQNWIGDKKLDMLQKLGKDSLIGKLSTELSGLVRTAAEASGPDWRSFPVPMLWQNEISKVMLHVRQEQEHQTSDEKGGGTRFIFDLALTRMGNVQLDGMLRDKRLDVIVRTQNAISYPMQEAMKIAYADALNGTDIFGEITFQGDLKQWMHVVKGNETMAITT